MRASAWAAIAVIGIVAAIGVLTPTKGPVYKPVPVKCVQANSSGSFACNDSGGFPSTCATATCPEGYTLTGGGGACAAGDRKIKSLFPRLDRGEFSIACEEQGVDPQANAICCQL